MRVIICLMSVSYSPPATRPGYTPQMFNKALQKKKKNRYHLLSVYAGLLPLCYLV